MFAESQQRFEVTCELAGQEELLSDVLFARVAETTGEVGSIRSISILYTVCFGASSKDLVSPVSALYSIF